jgi:hypothetical protein
MPSARKVRTTQQPWHYFMYDFGRVHQTLYVTPAMEADVTDHVWSAFAVLAFGAFWLFLAGWFVWAGGVWEWDSLGFAFVPFGSSLSLFLF